MKANTPHTAPSLMDALADEDARMTNVIALGGLYTGATLASVYFYFYGYLLLSGGL